MSSKVDEKKPRFVIQSAVQPAPLKSRKRPKRVQTSRQQLISAERRKLKAENAQLMEMIAKMDNELASLEVDRLEIQAKIKKANGVQVQQQKEPEDQESEPLQPLNLDPTQRQHEKQDHHEEEEEEEEEEEDDD